MTFLRTHTTSAVVVLLLLAGGGAIALALTNDHGSHRASASRPRAPVVLVPRQRPHARVVEPVAGEVAAPAPAPVATPEASGPPPKPPSDAEVRSELAQLDSVSKRYDFASLDFSARLLPGTALPQTGWHASIASTFDDYYKPIACGGVLHPTQLGVAHKSAPCGTMVTFVYGGRAIRVPVIDRGPYIAGREWDFTGATAAALRFPGLGTVRWTLADTR